VSKLSINYVIILSLDRVNFEDQNKALMSSIFFINYCIIIIIKYYNRKINKQYNYYIANEVFLKQCHTQQNVAVTVLLPLPVTKADSKTFCPMSRIGPVTARPPPQR